MRGLTITPPVIMGKAIVPQARGMPITQSPITITKGFNYCAYNKGIENTEVKQCCGGKLEHIHFIRCGFDDKIREYRVCFFCKAFKEKEKDNDSGNQQAESSISGIN